MFPIGIKERLVDFLAKVSQAKDIRELVADGVISFCEHTRHVRKWKDNEVLSALEKESDAIGENDDPEKLLDRDKDGGLFERFLSLKIKAGNSLACLSSECPCDLLFLKRLSQHFLDVRSLASKLEVVREVDGILCKIDAALWLADNERLRSVIDECCGGKPVTNSKCSIR